jgi:PIN domain nuclease of toxin-antitoxin system
MTLLLDTNALIWFLDDGIRLPASTRTQIETTPTVFVSIASLGEIATAFLKQHNADLHYDEADLERDRDTLHQLRAKATNNTP